MNMADLIPLYVKERCAYMNPTKSQLNYTYDIKIQTGHSVSMRSFTTMVIIPTATSPFIVSIQAVILIYKAMACGELHNNVKTS